MNVILLRDPPHLLGVLEGDACPSCQRSVSRPYFSEQEVRHQLRDLNIQGPLLICPTCGHYVLQRDEVRDDNPEELGPNETYSSRLLYRPKPGSTDWCVLCTPKERNMGQQLNPETGKPLTEMVGPNGGPYVEAGKRMDGGTYPTGGPFTQEMAPPPEHILQFFDYGHLPYELQSISSPFYQLAHSLVEGQGSLPRNPERTVALRKLLEAKDAAVRAVIAK